MTVTIREIKESDKAQWTELWNKYLEFYASTVPNRAPVTEQVTETTFSRFFDPTVELYGLVAEDDETHKLVGFANYYFLRHTWTTGNHIMISDLFVDEARRSAGIGRKLIKRVFEIADEEKAAYVSWMTQDNNYRAQLLFSKVGTRDGLTEYQRPYQDGKLAN